MDIEELRSKLERKKKIEGFDPKSSAMFKEILTVIDKLGEIKTALEKEPEEREENEYYDEINSVHDAVVELKDVLSGKEMNVNIPLDEFLTNLIAKLSVSFTKIEQSIKAIPKVEIPSTISLEERQVDDIIDSVDNIKIPEFPTKEIGKMFDSLSKSMPKFDFKFDYSKFDDVIKAIKKIKIGGTTVTNSGPSRVGINNGDGSKIDPATSGNQETLIANQTNNSQTGSIIGVDYVSGRSGVDSSTEVLSTVSYEHHEIHGNSHYWVQDYAALGSAETLDFCVETAAGTKEVHLVFDFKSSLLATLEIYEGSDTDSDGTLIVQRANNRALTFIGSHDAEASSATVMTDSTAAFTVDALIGWTIYNVTDGSFGVVTDNDATTVTVAALAGGTDNDWDTNDVYELNRSLTTIKADCNINALGTRLGGIQGGSGTNPSTGVPGGATRANELILRPATKYVFRFTSGAAANIISS